MTCIVIGLSRCIVIIAPMTAQRHVAEFRPPLASERIFPGNTRKTFKFISKSSSSSSSSFPFYIHCVRTGRGLDVPKQITLSDHCFGFKLVHNFHRPDALSGVKPPSPFRPWGNCSTPRFPQQRIWLKSKNHCHDESKEQIGGIS